MFACAACGQEPPPGSFGAKIARIILLTGGYQIPIPAGAQVDVATVGGEGLIDLTPVRLPSFLIYARLARSDMPACRGYPSKLRGSRKEKDAQGGKGFNRCGS